MLSKINLRKILNEKRRAIDVQQQQQAALAAAEIFSHSDLFEKVNHIACYCAYSNEFDTMPLIKIIWQALKHCYLPVMVEDKQNVLAFVEYQAGDALEVNHNKSKILEPIPNSHNQFPIQDLDLVFVPLLGFDLNGNRLGSGGGYYDKAFQFLAEKNQQKPLLIGLAYQQQQVEIIPRDGWDLHLNGVLTEQQLLIFPKLSNDNVL
jgi:5-formyltetrahydrofolate cyclo-ligase